MTGSLDPALWFAENERIEQSMQLLRGFLRPPALTRSCAPEKHETPTVPIDVETSGANSWESLR